MSMRLSNDYVVRRWRNTRQTHAFAVGETLTLCRALPWDDMGQWEPGAEFPRTAEGLLDALSCPTCMNRVAKREERQAVPPMPSSAHLAGVTREEWEARHAGFEIDKTSLREGPGEV